MEKDKEKTKMALKIKEVVLVLNELITEAEKEGLSIELKTNESVMTKSTPPLQVTISKIIKY